MAQEKAEQYPDKWTNIKNALEAVKSKRVEDYVKLSIAAKMLYLVREKRSASLDELVGMTPNFRWTITKDQVRDAGSFLQSLGLVSAKKTS